MATSGSVDFTLKRNKIITKAMIKVGAIEAGETPEAEEFADVSDTLNAMIKEWDADGYHLWKKREGVLFLKRGKVRYELGPNSSDHATEETGTLVKTALSADAATSATTITVSSITGISDAYNIGIVLDDGTFHWTTVNGAPSGSSVTLTAGLPSAASSGNKVYAYQKDLNRPLRITDPVRRRDEIAEQDIPIIAFSREEYFSTPNKLNQSLTTQVYYDPQIPLGFLYLWPAPVDINSTVRFTAALPVEDFDAAPNDPDFPQEWTNALIWGLADEISVDFGVPMDDRLWIKSGAAEKKGKLERWDNESESLYIAPDLTIGGWG